MVLGYYPDPADAEYYTFDRRADSRLTFMEHTQVRQMGAGPAAQAGVEHLSANGLDQFWIDLDADVLDPALMPVVDAPNLVGLSYAELTEALGVFLASGRAAGLEVTIFDPDLDPTGEIAAAFVDALVEAFQGAKPWRRWVAPSGPWVFLGERPRIFAGNHRRGVQLNAPTRQFVVILDPLSA